MSEPAKVDGWNVAHLAGGMLFSSDDFIVQFSSSEVDKLIAILNADKPGKLRANNGDVVMVTPSQDSVILTRVNDPVYPHGIILPVKAFSDFDEKKPVTESLERAFVRVGSRIKCTSKSKVRIRRLDSKE